MPRHDDRPPIPGIATVSGCHDSAGRARLAAEVVGYDEVDQVRVDRVVDAGVEAVCRVLVGLHFDEHPLFQGLRHRSTAFERRGRIAGVAHHDDRTSPDPGDLEPVVAIAGRACGERCADEHLVGSGRAEAWGGDEEIGSTGDGFVDRCCTGWRRVIGTRDREVGLELISVGAIRKSSEVRVVQREHAGAVAGGRVRKRLGQFRPE